MPDVPNEIAQTFLAPKDLHWPAVLPVLIVIVAGILALLVEIVRPKHNNNVIAALSLAGLAVAGYFCFRDLGAPATESFAGMVLMDRFGQIMQFLMVLACALTLIFSEEYLREKRIAYGEFYPLILWSLSGAMLMVTTKNMLMVFLGLEILSIALYVLAGLSRNEARSEESALKYFLLGAFASGFLLYGIALIYGATGSLHFDSISAAWATGLPATQGLLLMGLGMALIGFCFKSAFVPFHQWTPDVYQGAPTNVTAFMAAVSKIAAVATLYRFLEACSPMQTFWIPALSAIAVLTMTVGNLIAIVQKDVKRVLGYSSIAHAGYILVAILAHAKAPDQVGFSSLAYYLLAYTLMTVGAFAVVTLAVKKGQESTKLSDLNGLWQRSPFAAIMLVIFMVSLIGIPPTAGFFGKLGIFRDAVSADLMPLAIALAINSVLSLYYYLGIAMAAFVAEPSSEDAGYQPMRLGAGIATAICAFGIIASTVFFSPLSKSLFGEDDGKTSVISAQVDPDRESAMNR